MAHRNLTPAGDATSLASSSSTLDSNINSSVYDVFINHRGPEVKKGLASHIYHGLIRQGLRVFLDQQVLQEGEKITTQIEGAIRTASVHIAIFSQEYANSRWCLDELLLMVESGSTILPIFYNVQPSDLRWTPDGNRVYAQALRTLQNKRTFDSATKEMKPRHNSDTIDKWRKVLSDVSEISGFELKQYNGDEGELVDEVVQQVLVISLPQSLRGMEVEVKRLNNLIYDIKAELDQVQMNPKRVVKAWLDKAGEAIESSRSIRSDYQQHNCMSCCPNCFRISKLTRDWKVNAAQLHSERQSDFPPSGEYGDYTPPAQIQIEIPRPGFVGNAIQSAQLKLEERLIEDSNIRIIGVYGMGGVGKTSLLQTINNSLKVRNSFDPIIWVTVSRDYDILNLQDRIANRLNLQKFPDKSDLEGRNHRLWSYLRDKKFLVILDDMWKSLELQSLGVSLNDTGSKIVLTTRIREVCTSMEADETIKVEPLSEEEGWQLFCSRAFRNGNVPQEKEDVARKIAGECKCLPLAINVVAAAMRNCAYQHQWEHALHQMQNIDVKEGVMGNWSKMRELWLIGLNQDYLPQDMQAMKDLESFRLYYCNVERLALKEFQKLAYLEFFECQQLKELPAELPCLRALWIRECTKLEELELGMGFPKLERLTLIILESLECVGAVAAASGSGGLGEGASPLPPMLKSLYVVGCPKLKRLRGGWDKLKCVEEIRGSREWWDAIQWEDPNMKTSLESKLKV